MSWATNKSVCALLLASSLGCGGDVQTPREELTEPLSVEKWRSLSKDVKYEGDTLEQLHTSEPRFADEAVWKRFLATEVMPARKRDFPKAGRPDDPPSL